MEASVASRGVNKVILVGNVGNDPEVRYMPNGNAVANISVATSDTWKDRNTGDQQERTEWHRVVFFNRLAEIVEQYVKKGSKLYLEGRLQTRSWEQDGVKRYSTEIVANEMQMLDSRGGGNANDGIRERESKPKRATQDSAQGGDRRERARARARAVSRARVARERRRARRGGNARDDGGVGVSVHNRGRAGGARDENPSGFSASRPAETRRFVTTSNYNDYNDVRAFLSRDRDYGATNLSYYELRTQSTFGAFRRLASTEPRGVRERDATHGATERVRAVRPFFDRPREQWILNQTPNRRNQQT